MSNRDRCIPGWDKKKCDTPKSIEVKPSVVIFKPTTGDTKYVVCLDNSVSMLGAQGNQIITNLNQCRKITYARITNFGAPLESRIFVSLQDALSQLKFDQETYVNGIKVLLESPESNGMNVFLFHGDGEFTAPNGIIPIIDKAAKEGKFNDLSYMVITFASKTSKSIIDKLTMDLKTVMLGCPNAIKFIFYKFDHKKDKKQLQSLISKIPEKTSVLPPGYINVFNLFGILPEITASELSTLLQENPNFVKLGLLSSLRDNMINILNFYPHLLNKHLYAKLHKALRIAYRNMPNEYSNMIEKILSQFQKNSEEYAAIKQMMVNAFSDADNAEIKKTLNEIDQYSVGWMRVHLQRGKTYTIDDILALSKEKNTSILDFFKGGVEFTPITGKINVEYIIAKYFEYGMPILSMDAPIEICREALRLMFLQISTATIPPASVFLALMCLLSKDFTLPPVIIDFIKRAIFNDEAYICKMLDLKLVDGKIVMDNLFYRADLLRCLAHVFQIYKKEMFPVSFGIQQDQEPSNSKFTPSQIEMFIQDLLHLYKAISMNEASKQFLKEGNGNKYVSTIKKEVLEVIGQTSMSPEFNVGDIYLLPSHKGDPKINTPSIVCGWYIEVHTGNIVLVYCEKPMDCNIATSITSVTRYSGLRNSMCPEALKAMGYTLDTRCVRKLPKGAIKLAEEVDDATLKELNKVLMELDQNETGDMAPGAPLNQALYDANVALVRSILNPSGTRKVMKTVTAPLPNSILMEILGIPPTLIAALKSGANLNKAQLIKCLQELTTRVTVPVIPESFVHNGDTFPISLELVAEIQKDFETILSGIMGKPTTLSELSNVTCMVCLDEKSFKSMQLLPCGSYHWMCYGCLSDFLRGGELPHGTTELVSNSKYCCPYDKSFLHLQEIDTRVVKYYATHPQGPPVHTVTRPCARCNKLFEQDTGCGASDADYQTLCEPCRPKPKDDTVKLMKCPGPECYVKYVDHDACAHITCPNTKCNTHFCGKCQYVFTPEQIPLVAPKFWKCLGNCNEDNVDAYFRGNTYYDSDNSDND